MPAKVLAEVPPNTVDVRTAVAGVVELEHKGRSLEPVVVGLEPLCAARPTETYRAKISILQREPTAQRRPPPASSLGKY